MEKLKESLDLSLYKENDRYSDYLVLELKEDIVEKNIISFLKEEKEFLDKSGRKEIQKAIDRIERDGYKKVMEEIKSIDCYAFQFLEGNVITNKISYIDGDLDMFCDGIFFVLDGKVIFECYWDSFTCLRNHMIKSIKNPLGKSLVITITG